MRALQPMRLSKYAKKIRTKVTSRPYNKEFLTTSCFPLAYVYDTPMLSTALTALHIILYFLTILDNSQQAVYLSCDGHIGGILTDSLVIFPISLFTGRVKLPKSRILGRF